VPCYAPEQTRHSPPLYDLHAETEIRGLIDEVNLLSLGTRKAFGEPIIKNGDDRVHIDLCAKPSQQWMGISFKKGGQVPDVGSRVKQDLFYVILAQELVKGVDRLFAPQRQDQVLTLGIGVLGRRDHSQPRSQSFRVLAAGDC
jgi:hypothetical protein